MTYFNFRIFCILILAVFSQASLRDLLRKADGCPDTSGISGICRFDPTRNCLRQSQCPEGYKCCPYGCGSECLAVTVHFQHPGTCPITTVSYGKQCFLDAMCKANEKCCNGLCATVRAYAVPVTSIMHNS